MTVSLELPLSAVRVSSSVCPVPGSEGAYPALEQLLVLVFLNCLRDVAVYCVLGPTPDCLNRGQLTVVLVET